MRHLHLLASLPVFLASQAHAWSASTSHDGFDIQWTLVFYPGNALNVAACPTALESDVVTLYHLRHKAGSETKSLWRSTNGGVNWTNLRSVPAGITSIACGGAEPSLFALHEGQVHRFYGSNLNSDELVYGPRPELKSIQTGGGGYFDSGYTTFDFVGLNQAGSLRFFYRSGGSEWEGFYGVSSVPTAAVATLGWHVEGPFDQVRRAFSLGEDHSTLAYNNVAVGDYHWKPITGVPAAVDHGLVDISASHSTVLYVLRGPSGVNSSALYRADFSEANCTDGIDNDRDSGTDAEDPDCQ
jgi:hypothetical protein